MIFKKTVFIFITLIGTHFGLSAAAADTTPSNPPPSSKESVETFVTPQTAPSVSEPSVLAPLPSSEEMTNSYESSFIRMLVTLLGLVILVIGTFWVLRRLGRGKLNFGSSGRSINILEKRPLSPKSMLYLVEIGKKRILIAESQLEVRSLTQIEEETSIEED